MTAKMKAQEVAALLDKSIEQVRRYHKQGLLTTTRNGNELLFDRDEVIAFAQSRGIHTPSEREVPQGPNPTMPHLTGRQAAVELLTFRSAKEAAEFYRALQPAS